jgi:hypothetical protein
VGYIRKNTAISVAVYGQILNLKFSDFAQHQLEPFWGVSSTFEKIDINYYWCT